MSERRMSECPPTRVWDEIASGLLKGEKAMGYLEHASRCEACAQLLEESLEVFGPDEAEEPAPAKVIPLVPARRPSYERWGMAAAVLLAAVAGVVYWNRPADPLVQLAQVYGRERTAEVRLAGAAHSAWRPARAGEAVRAERSVEWLKAAAAVRAGLDASPRDARLLHAQGRLALMENRPEDAIAAFRSARDLGGVSDELTIDLASAYYQRALLRGEEGASDLTLGQELLGPVLQRTPDHPVALFNRALIAAELQQLPQAIADLERLLRVEPDANWRKEASEKLEKLKARWRGFLERDAGEDERRLVEVALDRVLRDASADYWPTARRLAGEHGDPWLEELAALPGTAPRREAMARLAGLAEIRLTAQRGRYRTSRAEALPLETATLDPPLAAWRDFELAYRSTHSGGAFSCQVARIPPRYRWLWTQAAREAASCALRAGDLAGHRRLGEASREAAVAANLRVSAVRSEAILAGEEFLRGRYRESMARQRVLLGMMVGERLPLGRAHEPVHSLMLSTRALGRHYASRSAALLAVALARGAGLRYAEFTDRVNVAELALRTGDRKEAMEQYRQAMDLYHGSGEEAATESARAWAETIMAEATDDAGRLLPFHTVLEQTTDIAARLPYLRARARWAPPAEAERRLEECWRLLRSAQKEGPPGYWREEVALAADRLIELRLAQGRPAEAWSFVQELLAWNRDERVGDRAGGPAGPTVLSLRRLGSRVGVWKADAPGRVSFRWADGDFAASERAIRRLRRLAGAPATPLAEIDAEAASLSAALFGAWLVELPVDGLVIFQAEGILAAAPYSLMKGRAGHLGHEQRIAYTTGPAGWGGAAGPAPVERRALLVDATRAPGLTERGLAPLPAPEEEWAALRRYTAEAEWLRAPDAARVRQAMRGVGLLHYAGHAQVRPGATGLVLGRETLGEIGAGVPPRVVLSACSTSRPFQEEEDSLGPGTLAEAFLRAGANEAIASDWDLDSRAAAALMGSFYEELARSEEMGMALRTAVRRLSERPEFRHPYYWAGARWVIAR